MRARSRRATSRPKALSAEVQARRGKRINRVLALLVAIGVAAGLGLAFVTHAPNRLLLGAPVALHEGLAGAQALWLAPAAVLAVAIFRPLSMAWACAVLAASGLLLAVLLALAGGMAVQLAATSSPLARTSFGAGFWIMSGACVLALTDALQRLRPALRPWAGLAAMLPALLWAGSGALGELSIFKEYANRQDVFHEALLRHLQIVATALLPTLLIGLPLGVAAQRSSRLARPLFVVLNIIQTVPAIALFGLLMAPLVWLGLGGVGLLPAVIALALYSLLPIVRSTAAGLAQVAAPVLEAATGMGMSASQVFWRVRAPIALPLLLSGLRVCMVQAIGLAVLAALIGAGGLGALMFQGLLSTAIDLVLLGVLPVVAMALAVDMLFRAASTAGPNAWP